MIVRLDRNTPMTCFKPRGWDCESVLLRPENVYCHVYRAYCPQPDTTKRKFDGCQWVTEKVPAAVPPTIRYPAFEVDENGRVCFIWDKLLWDQPDGRYMIDFYVCGEKRACAQLQLESRMRFTKPINKKQGCGYGCRAA